MGETDLMQHALKNNGHRCYCNTPLTFIQMGSAPKHEDFVCYCERCKTRSVTESHVVYVRGRGADPDLAYIDWIAAMRRAD